MINMNKKITDTKTIRNFRTFRYKESFIVYSIAKIVKK